MGILNKNINFVWYGDNCESCTDFDFYSGTSIRSEFENVLRVVDIKDGGLYMQDGHCTYTKRI